MEMSQSKRAKADVKSQRRKVARRQAKEKEKMEKAKALVDAVESDSD